MTRIGSETAIGGRKKKLDAALDSILKAQQAEGSKKKKIQIKQNVIKNYKV